MVYRPDLDATASYWGFTRRQLIGVAVVAAVIVVAAIILF